MPGTPMTMPIRSSGVLNHSEQEVLIMALLNQDVVLKVEGVTNAEIRF